jgi:hypothetical protein
MTPTIIACYFGRGAGDQWPRLARVLEYSARQHCPAWTLDLRELGPAPGAETLEHEAYAENTHKLDHWVATASALPDGAEVLLLDVDAVILRPLEDIWTRPFELAFTSKRARFPFNMGVVFLRVSDRTRQLLERWRAENARMLGDELYHRPFRLKYGGINQAAFGAMLEQHEQVAPIAPATAPTLPASLLPLSCVEWNCEDATWSQFDQAATRILHVKSALRRTIFAVRQCGAGSRSHRLQELAKLWDSYEQNARRAATR